MVRVITLLFLVVWLLGAYGVWVETVRDTATAIQFAVLTLPATAVLVIAFLFSHKLAE
jgi:hypothetical protein